MIKSKDIFLASFCCLTLNTGKIFSQDSSAVLQKLSAGVSATHNTNFKSISIPCNTTVPSLYNGYTIKTYWQPSLEVLYNHYFYYEKKKFLRNYFFTTGLKINYEKYYRAFDTTCWYQSPTSGNPIIIDERTTYFNVPIYLSYRQNLIMVRAGAVFSFFAITHEKDVNRKNEMINQKPRGALFFAFNYLTLRADYTFPFRKIRPFVFCFYNGLTANEFGAGIGIHLKRQS